MINTYCTHLPVSKKLDLVRRFLFFGESIEFIYKSNKNIFRRFSECREYISELIKNGELIEKARMFDANKQIAVVPVELGNKNESYFEDEFEYGAMPVVKFKDLSPAEKIFSEAGIDSTYKTIETFESKMNYE